MSTFYLETYGCSLNTADSDILVGRLNKLGFTRGEIKGSQILIINTCGVKEPTEDRIIHRLEELSKLKKPLIITGCLPKISYNRIIGAAPEFSAILGPQSIESIGHIIQRVIAGEKGIIHLDSDQDSKLRYYQGPPSTSICTIPICEGCLGACAYCAVRFARGAVSSYSISEINDIVRKCVHLGYKEIRLTSQDAGAFGSDTGETLVDLLGTLDEISGEHIFRLGMMNPNLILDSISDIVDVMMSNHFFKFFHIPLQSGSDAILRLMNRKYSVAEWIDAVSIIRQSIPNATIATDIIVGFPGETEANFSQTLKLIKSVQPEIVNISKYGDRPHTSASQSENKVDTNLKKNRSRALSKIVREISRQKNRSWIGWTGPVLVTEPASRGGYLARMFSYKPVIILENVAPGINRNVKIIGAEPTHLLGELLSVS